MRKWVRPEHADKYIEFSEMYHGKKFFDNGIPVMKYRVFWRHWEESGFPGSMKARYEVKDKSYADWAEWDKHIKRSGDGTKG